MRQTFFDLVGFGPGTITNDGLVVFPGIIDLQGISREERSANRWMDAITDFSEFKGIYTTDDRRLGRYDTEVPTEPGYWYQTVGRGFDIPFSGRLIPNTPDVPNGAHFRHMTTDHVAYTRDGDLYLVARLRTPEMNLVESSDYAIGTPEEILFRTDDLVPGFDDQRLIAFFEPLANEKDDLVFYSFIRRFEGQEQTPADGLGFSIIKANANDPTGSFEILAHDGMPVPGEPGLVFDLLAQTGLGAYTARMALREDGEAIFIAGVRDENANVESGRYLVSSTRGVLLRPGDPYPGVDGLSLVNLERVAVNDAGAMIIQAVFAGTGVIDGERVTDPLGIFYISPEGEWQVVAYDNGPTTFDVDGMLLQFTQPYFLTSGFNERGQVVFTHAEGTQSVTPNGIFLWTPDSALEPIPLPASLWMMLFGMGLTVAASRKTGRPREAVIRGATASPFRVAFELQERPKRR